MFRNIAVGISGGVDSAVSAYLLKEKGFNVVGVFMKNWDEYEERGHCSGDQDLLDAEYTCNVLGIELKQVNFVKQYWNSVFTKFLEDYQNGLTPNPDILCNKYIKFDSFHKYALDTLKCDAIATGHYAKTNFGSYLENYKPEDDVCLKIPRDSLKDQTFFLSAIEKDALRKTMFPLSNFLKSEVKHLAEKCGLKRLTQKKESTGICFVGQRKFKDFIKEYILSKHGNFVDLDTQRIVGHHQGVHQWTVGQRCRLHSFLQPYYVANKEVSTNIIYVASGHNNPALFSEKIFTKQINWFSSNNIPQVGKDLKCRFRFQHTKPLVNCIVSRVTHRSDELFVLLEKPLRAVTPGQYAIFYNDTECLGCARILNAISLRSKNFIENKLQCL